MKERPRRITIPVGEYRHEALSCDQCGEPALLAKDAEGNTVRLTPAPRKAVLLAREGDQQVAYLQLVYDLHFCYGILRPKG